MKKFPALVGLDNDETTAFITDLHKKNNNNVQKTYQPLPDVKSNERLTALTQAIGV